MEGLRLEWELVRQQIPKDARIASIYFGGGTPSLLPCHHLEQILGWTRTIPWTSDCEITLEANPEEADFDAYSKIGINRVSIGVQSLDDRSLQTLERTHSAKKAIEAIHTAADAGISNISIDLMYDLPNQTESSWTYTLKQLESLPIQHLSLYNLTIEPHTAFAKRSLTQPSSEQSLRFLELATDQLKHLGFHRYEISAFAKNNHTSRHNLGYWTYRPFFGLGPSAFSYWNGERFQNIPRLHKYTALLKEGKSPVSFREKLDFPNNIHEQLAVGLRLLAGTQLSPSLPQTTRTTLHELQKQHLVTLTNDTAKLTERGLLLYDEIASRLI